jgi:hypothetical protein
LTDDAATICHLARKGYGSLVELNALDTPELLDVIEYERIQQDLELYHIQQSRV